MGLWRHAIVAIKESDVVLEIVDARLPQLSRNLELERIVMQQRKQLVLVLNKSDLISKKTAESRKKELQKVAPTIFVSGHQKKGISKLKMELRKLIKKKPAVISVVGYPNTGKSTILNALAGRKAARTSSQAGYTRGRQRVKIGEEQFILDTPGVIPFQQKNEFELALMASKNPNQLKNPEVVALQLAEWIASQNPDALMQTYGIEWKNDSELFLEELARKKGKLLKGGIADALATAALFILDWQKGKLRV